MNRFIDPHGKNQGNGKQARSRRGQSGKEEAAGPLTGRQAEKQRWTVSHGVENNLVCVCLGFKSWGQQVCEMSLMTGGSVVDALV